ncbi:hypothetical protein OS493_020445 [Desmophyllum pertusum]|uniref:Uncharacterized protein n=1 Tax=Desmophyllum pertusum TaxID=174260 RepID=A0A9W9ZC94_9CNID|nr:hypothetical protein OS493_020445 [Desmophyllum pertusum]
MELKLKLLIFVPAILLLMEVSPIHGIRKRPVKNTIPKEKCQKIVVKPNKDSHFTKGPICVRLDESQKTDRLKNVGGYNPRYVAINRREASKFTNLITDVKPLTAKGPNYSQKKAYLYSNRSDLLSILRQQDKAVLTGAEEGGRGRGRMSRASIAGTTTSQQCFEAGSLLQGGGFRRLCTECAAITHLPADVFPPFINEVICGDSDFCFPAIGGCQQKVLKFTFLRSTGEFEQDDDLGELFGVAVFVEELEEFEEDIRVCCECRLFSFLGKK